MTNGPELCLVSAEGGSAFMEELLEVVADAVRTAGGRARTAVGRYPEAGPDTVYLVVPHEYFVVSPDADFPSAEDCRRTIGFCVEHPGTATFERNAELVRSLGGAVDINHDSTAELRRRGVTVEHFQLGYTPLWDLWGGDLDSPRDLDVTYLGTAERRRSMLLGSYARELAPLRTRLLTPPHEPMTAARVDFLPGKAKFAHLARSRFLLNLHREQKETLEWVRTLEAMTNGCVVVSESSTEVEPLVPGEHLMLARAQTLGAVTAALAKQPERERHLRASAYEFVKTLDMQVSARMLIELAKSLVAGTTPPPPAGIGPARRLASGVRNPANALAVDTPSFDVRFAGERSIGGTPSARGTALSARVAQRTAGARRSSERRWVQASGETPFDAATQADVDVLLVRRPGEVDPDDLIADLIAGTRPPRRVLLGEDGVHPWPKPRPAQMLLHTEPLGRGLTRNALLERSTAPWLLVLDGGMRASEFLLERLLTAADSEGTDVVHCPIADPLDGLIGALPPEERRLRTLPYLGSGYLVRRSLVDEFGGWNSEVLFEGLEDHLFWQQVVTASRPTTLVQQVLLRRLRPDPDSRPLDHDPHRVWSAVTPKV
ncbi:glycosyltransferase family protein [Amycolatopsis sp. H20-H5]|uniref:glycosyltransferase family protein n=1 Tax=Amycolatopsis sp. H20-H5 TaxID=3046309 RepID=UPI002DB87195|nr:glycosyltransferase [Amycolatopsis sp. H20-H5]MEC3981436.1 glycosyltransferase [Amycolatopsis sp. H20-H5]